MTDTERLAHDAPIRPTRQRIHGERTVRSEIYRRSPQRGMRKAIAFDAGISESFLSLIATGKRPMTPKLAAELGFRLAWVRAEELALADKIEAELSLSTVAPIDDD